MTRRDEKGIVFVPIYVDDSLVVGNDAEIEPVIQDQKKDECMFKIDSYLDYYLSCKIIMSEY